MLPVELCSMLSEQESLNSFVSPPNNVRVKRYIQKDPKSALALEYIFLYHRDKKSVSNY
jgi:hypothetical protein